MSNNNETQNNEAVQSLLDQYTKKELQEQIDTMFAAALHAPISNYIETRVEIVALWAFLSAFVKEVREC